MIRKTLSTRIEEFEKKHVGLTRNAKECCIYKLHEQLHDVSEKAYKPVLLAIGPYNDQGKVGQGFMEEHKLHYLQQMLKRTKGTTLKCYGEHISQNSDEFVEMMVLDGCFIIELFHNYEICWIMEDDPIFQMKWVLPRIARDLLLLENQLPFFVLAKLFEMSENSNTLLHNRSTNFGEQVVDIDEKKDGISVESSTSITQIIQTRLTDLALNFFFKFLPFQWNANASSYNSNDKIKHLLCLVHEALTPSLPNMNKHQNIHSATELKEAGIKFKKADKSNGFSIKFNNGLMEISPLCIEDHIETYLRNLITYEQYCDRQKSLDYVHDYVQFMENLINSPKDVELLRRKGIISNCLGDDEIISTMVNKLGHYISVSSSSSIYARTSKNLNMHCRRHRNVWMAKLRRDYFNSPWALVSFLGAVLLLALAITQAIFSIIH
ncbi:hypothetical protein I3842_01G107700 [Carya illinoinensis]|uniref:Uncharacterized protein n=1 Tax=Carya illinoinensis TaxID=32201 RepID=A0A922K348_CARIL|nr:hypothetical protein I3842_01G107700 [Carya illinoinensis]